MVGGGSVYSPTMSSDLPPVTADTLDLMSPDERREEFRRRIITDSSDLSDDLRAKIKATTERLTNERRRIG